MQQYPLLQTKLYIPPTRPELVSRPRLIERLNAGLPTRDAFPRALTLVSAPAGFGKTTLVSEWVQAMGGRTPPIAVAWLSLDEGDNDPSRFLSYLIAALRTIEARHEYAGNIGKGVLSALQSPQPPPAEAVLTSLINEIAAISSRFFLVLDDHHTIESSQVDDALAFLLERLPPQMHLVIASREDPNLPLARLRARSQLTELRAMDLRFTSSEAAEFLNQVMGLDLSERDIAALERRTEGWIAGLQLAAISMQGHKDTSSFISSFAGSHRFVLDYLIEEVLEQQSESIQTFLQQTAVLNRLTGSLCDALTGHDNGQATLEMLERANLFIVPLDDERRWYRYHHLFADLLRQRLRQKQPDWIPTLHIRASEWYEQNGFTYEAIEHGLCAEDFERAAHLIEELAEAVWGRVEQTKLWRWLARLPDELVFCNPQLCIFHAEGLFISGQQDAAERVLQAAERALEAPSDQVTKSVPQKQGQQPDSDTLKLRGRVAATRAFGASFRGDVLEIIQHARQALEYLPDQDLTWRSMAAIALGDAHSIKGEVRAAYQARLEAMNVSKAAGNIYMILMANVRFAVTLRQRGQLRRVIEVCQQQLQLANENGLSQAVVVGWLLAIWGEVLAELNDLDKAIHQARKGTELTERGRDVAMLSWSYLCLMRVLFSTGNTASAEEIIQRMENIAQKYDVPPLIVSMIAAWQARIWLAQDKLKAASQWVGERRLNADGDLTYLHEMEYLVLARILLAQGRLGEAARLLHRLLEFAEAGGRISRVIEILLLQALASQAQGNTDQAIITLEKALTLAEPRGFVRTFVDEGPPMARLLYEAATRGIAPDYTRRLLAAFPVVETEESESATPREASQAAMVEPLSERELEVLQLIAHGLTNREIASRLFLSLNTVKAHTRNIYGKLGVHNRTQAVTMARALGILPST